MAGKKLHIISISLTLLILASQLFRFCDDKKIITEKEKPISLYLNHNDSVKYVGMNACRQCHENIYQTFIKTGMGRSFENASKNKSSADLSHATLYDKFSDLNYHAFLKGDSLLFTEYRLNKKDTLHSRTEQVNYIIGSGQHTNSHLMNVNGYIHQMPMTFYTQKQKWDLPPGFENGVNTRFSRKIGLECMSCHNGYPNFVMGSENKYESVPQGIDCERCHGPGAVHVELRKTTSAIDTSKEIDYSIVNPAKLSVELQFDLCQRCHLQGNVVLKEGKSFYDFKPGMKLNEFISVFLPKYKNADDEFIMASHADRLKQSACFIKSLPKTDSKELKPYKNSLTCVTCHNPHISVKETNKNVFNDACKNCHGPKLTELESKHSAVKEFKNSDCASCHMPLSGSIDIPHVTVHDHYIRKPITQKEKEKIKEFVGLFSVNEKTPDDLTKAKAYIQQYDKFEGEKFYLDSAQALLKEIPLMTLGKNLKTLIHLHFIKNDFKKILQLINFFGEQKCMNTLFIKKSYDNEDAWTCYRVAESFYNTGGSLKWEKWLERACALAPYNLDFRTKLGTAKAGVNDIKGAEKEFEYIISENPKFASAYGNLGYLKSINGFKEEGLRLFKIGLQLDPDNVAILINLAGYYVREGNNKEAITTLKKVMKIDPKNIRAKTALKQLGVTV